jgi:ABC-type transporter Mla MlaB component
VTVLRISRSVASSSLATLLVEGRVVAEWVPVLERECWLALQENGHVQLDLSAVTFVDGRGLAALRRLRATALEIINCPEFIGELLRTP